VIDLGIVIVNWNTCDLLRTCLHTLFTGQGEPIPAEALDAALTAPDRSPADDEPALRYVVVVVDNASSDGSAAMVQAEFPQVLLIASAENVGYPAGNNLGLRALGFAAGGAVPSPRYALLLNPDTEVPPGALAAMTRLMDEQIDIGAAGPRLVLPDGRLDKACKRGFPTPQVSLYHFSGLARLFPNSPRFGRYNMTYIPEDREADVDSVVGAYMQVRREAIAQAGLLDETFFMYGEDLDWAFRIKQAGWRIVYHPHVRVRHVKRAASRKSQRAQFEFWRAMLLFYRKHYRATTPLWLHALIIAGLLIKGGRPIWDELRQPA
jgi:hypothetical protein